MYRKKSNLIMGFFLLSIFAWTFSIAAQTNLKYQDRGNRHEGIKPSPVSGYDIELISLRADFKEEAEKLPDQFKLKFYLKEISEVYLTVRELDFKYYYWMDQVQPQQPWQAGFSNVFEWPTREVIQHQPLKSMEMYDLGVVVRLERSIPSIVERVAPVILYHSHFPKAIEGYLFTFKTNGDANLTTSIFKEGASDPTFTIPYPSSTLDKK